MLLSIVGYAGGANMLVVGAYRGGEIADGHPLPAMLERLRTARFFTLTTFSLGLLGDGDIRLLLSRLLHSAGTDAKLAVVMHDKTLGNPLYVKHLAALLAERVPHGPPRERSVAYLSQLRSFDVTSNVAQFLLRRIADLDEDLRRTLFVVSCLGIECDRRHLEAVAPRLLPGLPLDAVLRRAVEYGFVTVFGKSVRFAHDRIYQAFYESEPAAVRRKTHGTIGPLLLEHHDAPDTAPPMAVVVHLVKAASRLARHRDRTTLARACLLAGNASRYTAAFGEALRQYQAGITIAGDTAPEELRFELSLAAAECLYLTGRFGRADAMLTELLARADDPVPWLRVRIQQVRACLIRHKCADATALTVEALRKFGFAVPESPEKLGELAHREMEKARERIDAMGGLESLLELPPIDDKEHRWLMALVSEGLTAVYFHNPTMLILAFAYLMDVTLEKGVCDQTPICFLCYGFSHCVHLGRFEEAYRLGAMALRISSRFGTKATGKMLEVYGAFIAHTRTSLHESMNILHEGLRRCVATGDLLYAGLNALNREAGAFIVGMPLEQIAAMLEAHEPVVSDMGNDYFVLIHRIRRHQLDALRGDTAGLCALTTDTQREERLRAHCEESEVGSSRFHYHYIREQLLVYAGEFEQAFDASENAESLIRSMHSLLVVPEHRFFRIVATAGVLLRGERPEEDGRLGEILSADLEALGTWADSCPRNYKSRYLLARAYAHKAAGTAEKAAELCGEAIEEARRSAFITVEALAHQLMAQLHLTSARLVTASMHLREAEELYRRWGATAVAEAIRQTLHRGEMSASVTKYGREVQGAEGAVSAPSSLVSRALRIVAETSDPLRIARDLTEVLGRSCNALSGVLCMRERAELKPIVGYAAGTSVLIADIGLDACTLAAPSLIRTVYSTGTAVQIGDLSRDHLYANDKRLKTADFGSCLCVPVKSPHETIGALFLAHDRPDGCDLYRARHYELALSVIAPWFLNASLREQLEKSEERLRGALAERSKAEKRLRASRAALERQKTALQNKNEALRQVLCEVEEQKERTRRELIAGLQNSVLPKVLDMQMTEESAAPADTSRVEAIRTSLEAFTRRAPHIDLEDRRLRLTPREYEIATMIRAGLRGKEIARILHIDYRTVERHRNTIRKKLGLTGTDINLATYLRSGSQ
jgi:predicted ATPase/DNA-binding CsgD family transcriptional regulator